MNTSSIPTERGEIHYRERPGKRPTLLFLHGNLGSSRWWEPVLERLPAGWRGIAYDAIGYGLSQRTDRMERFSVPARLRDLIAFIDALGLEQVHLVAHSTASPVAIEYALLAPQRVATLTLIGPVPATGALTPEEAYPWLERMSADRELLTTAIRASAPHLDAANADLQTFVDDAATLAPLTLSAIARGIDAWQPRDRLRGLTLPVMIVRGEDDIMLEEKEAHLTLLSIPGAGSLEILHGAGHSPMIETPSGLTELLVTFIAEDWEDFEAIRQNVE